MRIPGRFTRHLVIGALLFLLVGAAYRNSFQSGWVLDNKTVIELDPRNKDATWENLKLIWEKDYWWPTMYTRAYRPLVTTTYWLNWSVLGKEGTTSESERLTGFHWGNLIAHSINAILVYFLMLKLLQRPGMASLAAGLFAVHPIATESVTNLIGRADEFLALSFLGCTLLYIRSTESAGLRRLPWLLATMLLHAAGLLSKESAIAFLAVPPVFDAIYRWSSEAYRENRARRILGDGLVYVLLSLPLLAVLWLRHLVFQHRPLPTVPFLDNALVRFIWSDANSLSVNLHHWILSRMTAFNIAGKAVWKLIWPVHLSSDYSYAQIKLFNWQLTDIENTKAVLGLVFILGTLAVAAWGYRRSKALSFFILFFWISYSPSSNLITLSSSIFAERFLYVPSIAFCALVVIAAAAIAGRLGLTLEIERDLIRKPWPRLLPHGIFIVILALYANRTYNRNFEWRSDILLSESAIKESPESFRGYFGLARAYHELDRVGRIDDVIRLAETGLIYIDALPDSESGRTPYLHLGMYYGLKGETVATRTADGFLLMNEKTQDWYRKAARSLERASQIDRLINETEQARTRREGGNRVTDTGSTDVYQALGMAYQSLGMEERALQSFVYMRHLNPRLVEAYAKIGYSQAALGHGEKAAISFLQCVILDPKRNDAWQALIDLYPQISKESGTVVDTSTGQPRLDANNPLVRKHLQTAYEELLAIAKTSEDPEAIQVVRNLAAAAYPNLQDEPARLTEKPAPPIPVFYTPGQRFFPASQ